MVDALERRVHELEASAEMPAEFVVPGQSRSSAALDLARTVIRRAERRAVALGMGDGSQVVPYLNRLSDLCWLLARSCEQEHLRGPHGTCAGAPRRGMMTAMQSPLSLPTEVAPAVPDRVEAVGWGVLKGLETARPGLEVDVAWCGQRRFKAKLGDKLITPGEGGRADVLLGLGDPEQLSATTLRLAGAAFASATGEAKSVALDLTGITRLGIGTDQAVQAAIEGFWGARYRFTRYHAGDPDPLELLTIVLDTGEIAAGERGLERGRVIADATWLARDLCNEPAGALTPAQLAEVAVEVAERGALEATILDEAAIAEAGLGGLLGVAAGSVQSPRLIKLVYEPSPAHAHKRSDGSIPTVALVGKGITFDSGGLSLKTAEGMVTMKTDMSGAAVVIATLGHAVPSVSESGCSPSPRRPRTCPGAAATKPGDVLKIRNGKTIEVVNTDCEGRLVLADGLSLAAEEEPDCIVDLATLTGACVVALGPRIAGLMGNDDRLISAVSGGIRRGAGEPTWPLPLPEAYRSRHRLRSRRHEEPGQAAAGAPSRPPCCCRSSSGTGRGPISTSPAPRVRKRTRGSFARVPQVSGSARCSSSFAPMSRSTHRRQVLPEERWSHDRRGRHRRGTAVRQARGRPDRGAGEPKAAATSPRRRRRDASRPAALLERLRRRQVRGEPLQAAPPARSRLPSWPRCARRRSRSTSAAPA